MAVAMKLTIGNTKITIMDDFCSAPDQKERDAAIKKKIYADALAAIRANPIHYYEMLERKERGLGRHEQLPEEFYERLRKEGKI